MTFLNPLVLFGMAAAAIPVILHLLNLRKLRTIEFSTLRFLKELQQTKIRKLKIRQILLLIIRTLLILFIVLAFARPALQGTILGSIGANAHSSVVFIVDDSFSMTAADERGELLKQAKGTLAQLLDLLRDGDEVFLVKLSDLPDATTGQGTHDFRTLRKTINDLQISSVTRLLGDALRLSARLLSRSLNANKEIYIVSDMQQSLFRSEVMSQRQAASLFGPDIRLFVMQLGNESPVNIAIDSVEIKNQIFEKEKPVSVSALIRNYSNTTIQNYVVSVFLEGVRVAQNSVTIEPWGSAPLEFILTPKKTGFLKGYVELEHDAVDQDNRRYFSFFIPEKISLVVVSPSPQESKFLVSAINAAGVRDHQSVVALRQLTPKEFQFTNLDTVDVVMLSVPEGFPPTATEKITSFINKGGGLIIFPGAEFQVNEITKGIIASLSLSPVEGITGSGSSRSSLSFKNVDIDHPIFSTVFEKEQTRSLKPKQQVESPLILRAIKRTPGKEEQPIVLLSDGTPFLSEMRMGSGRILVYSVAPTLGWSDFPVKGIFAPLLYRSVVYTSMKGKGQYSYTTGDQPIVTIPNLPVSLRTGIYKLVSPDGLEELISQPGKGEKETQPAGANLSVNIKRLDYPGFYSLMNQNHPLAILAVNPSRDESDLRQVSGDEMTKFWKQLSIEPSAITMLTNPEQVQKTIVESRYGVELWKHCIVIALLLALLEMLIARDSRKAMQQLVQDAA